VLSVQYLLFVWEKEARQRVEFTGVEIVSGAELAAPVKKVMTSPVDKATVGPHALEGRPQWRKMGAHTHICILKHNIHMYLFRK
jgi:hypothetical protein